MTGEIMIRRLDSILLRQSLEAIELILTAVVEQNPQVINVEEYRHESKVIVGQIMDLLNARYHDEAPAVLVMIIGNSLAKGAAIGLSRQVVKS
jgi:hypothetical protein